MGKIYTEKDGFTTKDLLHFGYGHLEAAYLLFNDNSAFLESAGYLAHLGIEVVLKAWHLHLFGQFKDNHKLTKLFDKLKAQDKKIDIGSENEVFLEELDRFYLLRYPRRKKGPIEIGSDMLPRLKELLKSFWQLYPDEIVESYERIDPIKKGGNILMEKKI